MCCVQETCVFLRRATCRRRCLFGVWRLRLLVVVVVLPPFAGPAILTEGQGRGNNQSNKCCLAFLTPKLRWRVREREKDAHFSLFPSSLHPSLPLFLLSLSLPSYLSLFCHSPFPHAKAQTDKEMLVHSSPSPPLILCFACLRSLLVRSYAGCLRQGHQGTSCPLPASSPKRQKR